MASALTASSVPIAPAPVEGTAFTAIVAKFTDADHETDPAKFAAQINWGDGHTTTGTVTADAAGGFDVKGTFTYAQRGTYRVVVSITDSDHDTATAKTSNVVADAPLTATGVSIDATRGKPLTNVVVARFTDANPHARASDFAATILWGDGRPSPGRVVANASGGFNVLGSHNYLASGTFSVKVQIHDGAPGVTAAQYYRTSNLISDGKVPADHIDPALVNPWGLVANPNGPWWDTNNGWGNSELFDGSGNPIAFLPSVTVPAPPGSAGPSAPTGIVFNNTAAHPGDFVVTNGTASGPAIFLFASEDGTISGWNPAVTGAGGSPPSTQAFLAVDNSSSDAIYKGLALLDIPAGTLLPAGPYLFASNFHSGNLDVFDSGFHPVTLPAGAFHDPTIPAGFAPFGVQALDGNLYVTYAKQDAAKEDDVAGPGNGYVDVYNPAGYLIQRLGGPGIQPELSSPWGITMAPADFGKFSNDLLVGNFGDSHVSAFDPTTGKFLGQLTDFQGKPLVLNGGFAGPNKKGLWGLSFGTGGVAGPTNTLFFTSGINGESDGLFGSVTAGSVSTASTTATATVIKPKASVVVNPGGGSTVVPGSSSGGGTTLGPTGTTETPWAMTRAGRSVVSFAPAGTRPRSLMTILHDIRHR